MSEHTHEENPLTLEFLLVYVLKTFGPFAIPVEDFQQSLVDAQGDFTIKINPHGDDGQVHFSAEIIDDSTE